MNAQFEHNDDRKKVKKQNIKQIRIDGLDKFYTKPSVSKQCIDYLNNIFPIQSFNTVIEPSAGNGSFLTQIDHPNMIGIDIDPEHERIIKQDFLTFTIDVNNNKNILTIGNPPFGKVSSLAVKFFNHASTFSNVIAFIVPKTFRRISIQNQLNLNFSLSHDLDIPTKPCSFEPCMLVKCCFQIWVRKQTVRTRTILPTVHHDWSFLPFGPIDENGQPTPPKNANFAIRAYGGKCGEIFKNNLMTLRPKSYHWIKTNIDEELLIERFASLNYSDSTNTARQNSIGKADLVKLYSDRYGDK